MVDSAPYISRPQAEQFLKKIGQSLEQPDRQPLVFQIWGLGGVGKSTLIKQVQTKFPDALVPLVHEQVPSFGATHGIETPVELMRTLHGALKPHFQPLPLFRRDIRQLRTDPDPFEQQYSKYLEAIAKLKNQPLSTIPGITSDQLSQVTRLAGDATGAIATVAGHPEIALLGEAGVRLSTVALSALDEVKQRAAIRHQREQQELSLSSSPEQQWLKALTQAFEEILIQWSAKCPIVLLLDTYEKASIEVDGWLWRSLANTKLAPHRVRLVIAGRYRLTQQKTWGKLQQDRNLLHEFQLNRFDQSKTQEYLQSFHITDLASIQFIYQRTKGLPRYLSWVKEKYANSPEVLALMSSQGEKFTEGSEQIVDLLLEDFDDHEYQIAKHFLQQISCCHWFDASLIQDLLKTQEKSSERDWFAWLQKQHFVEFASDRGYRLDDVAREIFRTSLWHNNRKQFWLTHEWLAEYFKQQASQLDVSQFLAGNPLLCYENEEWRNLISESLYHSLFSRNPNSKLELLTQIFSGLYLKLDLVFLSPLAAILSESDFANHPFLSKEIRKFLTAARDFLMFEYQRDPLYSAKNYGSFRQAIESACFSQIEKLSGFAKFAAYLYKSKYSATAQQVNWLKKAQLQAETFATDLEPEFLSEVFLQGLAGRATELGQWEDVLDYCEKILEVAEDSHPAWNNKGIAEYRLGRYEAALQTFDALLELYPDSKDGRNNRGLVLCELEQYEEAIAEFDAVIEDDPTYILAWNNRGNALVQVKRFDDAMQSFDESLERSSSPLSTFSICSQRIEALFNMGKNEAIVESCDRAFQQIEELFQSPPPSQDLWLGTVNYFGETIHCQDFLDAKPYLISALWIQKGMALHNLKQFEEALECFDQALLHFKESYKAVLQKGITLHALGRCQETVESFTQAIKLKPNFYEPLSHRGIALLSQENFSAALKDFVRADELNPNNPDIWNCKGVTFNALKRYEEAIAAYNKALELKPNSVMIWKNKATLFRTLKQPEEASRCYEQALSHLKHSIQQDPDNSYFWYDQGTVLNELKRYEEALECFNHVLELQTDYYEAWYSRAAMLMQLKRYEESLESYDRALALQPNSYDAWNYRGVVLYRWGQFEEAITSFDQALTINPGSEQTWINKGEAFKKLRQKEASLDAYHQAVTANPKSEKAWFAWGHALGEQRRYEEAVAAYDQSLQLNSEDAGAWNNKGDMLNELGRHEEAIACLDRAIQLEPDFDKAWNNRGIALRSLGRYSEAVENYKKAVEINPNYQEAWFNRAYALGQLWRNQEAIADYDRALELKPSDQYAWNNRGDRLNKLSRYEEALTNLDRAIELKSDYDYAWNNRGQALKGLGRYEEALASYDRALELKPDYQNAWQNRSEALSKLRRHEAALESYLRAYPIEQTDKNAWNDTANVLLLTRLEEALICCERALELDPDFDLAWNSRGLALRNLGRYEEAVEAYQQAVIINSNYQQAWFNLGYALSSLYQYQESFEAYEKALQLNSDDTVSWNNQGDVLVKLGRPLEALDHISKALELNPNYGLAWNNKGTTLRDLGRYEEAVEAYQRAIEINSSYQNAWFNLGNTFKAMERFRDALSSYDKALEIIPNRHNVLHEKANVLAKLERYDEALNIYDQAQALNFNCVRGWCDRAHTLIKLNQLEAAIASCVHALEITPDDPAILNNGLEVADRVIELDPNHPKAWATRSGILLKLGRYEEAFQLPQVVIEAQTEMLESLTQSEAWEDYLVANLSRFEGTLVYLNQAVEQLPDRVKIRFERGYLMYLMKRYEDAFRDFETVTTIQPSLIEAWLMQGVVLQELSRFGEAIQACNQALDYQPEYALIHYFKACLHATQAETQPAIESLQHAIELNSDYRNAASVASEFDAIREKPEFQNLISSEIL
jgi:tetratricopeptide (TPR) repeat protein